MREGRRKAGKWVREEPYEMTDHFPAAQVCLEERGSGKWVRERRGN